MRYVFCKKEFPKSPNQKNPGNYNNCRNFYIHFPEFFSYNFSNFFSFSNILIILEFKIISEIISEVWILALDPGLIEKIC